MSDTVRVGEYEKRVDLPPVRRQYRDSRGVVVEYLAHVIDRRVYETWVGDDGQKYGRWVWESGVDSDCPQSPPKGDSP